MSIDKFPVNQGNSEEKKEPSESAKRFDLEKEYFDIYVNNTILESFQKELRKFNFTDEQIDQFRYKVLDLNPEDRERLFSIPWEMKQKNLPIFLKRINQGTETIESYINFLINLAKDQKRKVGYHTDTENIVSKIQKSGEYSALSWKIIGKEKDHRDGDRPMAYYSYDYEHLYRTKNPNYIYIISIEENSKSGHKKDGNNQWGRAPELSVIEKIDFKEAVKKINELVSGELKKDQK